MRKVGELPGRDAAERFHGFLGNEKIANEMREIDGGHYAIWVHDEDLMQVASAYFDAFCANPDEPRFNVRRPAPEPAASPAKSRLRRAPSGRYYQLGNMGAAGVVTLILIGLSVLATVITEMPNGINVTRVLYFSEFYGRDFPEIRDGQAWRLVTPIFLHGGWLHLIFNMMWLFQLGGMIEILEGPRRLLLLTLVLAVLANTTQYLISGPNFLGMSGVVYGYLGYVWMMSRHSAGSRYVMPTQTVYFMVCWMIACLVGIIPGVANGEHVAGFVVGTAWGFLRSGYIGAARRRQRFKDKS